MTAPPAGHAPTPVSYMYTALPVEQQPGAPLMYLLKSDAATLLRWADVPNAKADYMAGYQRVYSKDRAEEITEFLDLDPKNIIPGAVIVTAIEHAVTVDEPTSDDGVAHLTITVAAKSFEERLKEVLDRFRGRLSNEERASIGLRDEALADLESVADADADIETAEDEEPGLPESYIAALTAELQAAYDDFGALPEARRSAIRRYIDSVSKPGLIIDGQHRVFGAKDVTAHEVVLPIVLVPGLTTAEQVFHFYVLNNKAKPLSPTELRRTVSTSLTNAEIDSLWERFERAGVNPEQARWTHKINTDPRSPFRELINFGFEDSGFLKENVAYQLVSSFVRMPRKYRTLYSELDAWSSKADLDPRLDYFYAFWQAIRERYATVWDEGVRQSGQHQFFYKASLLVLQEFILDQLLQYMNVRRMENKPTPFADLDGLKAAITALLNYLPPEFFSREWQHKQIDTTEGRRFLRRQMDEVIQNEGKNLGNRALFRK